MNERIQELAYQAEDYDDIMVDGGSEFHPVLVKKFAELIVRECCEVVKWSPSQFANDEYVKNIQEHFGVQE